MAGAENIVAIEISLKEFIETSEPFAVFTKEPRKNNLVKLTLLVVQLFCEYRIHA
jgi:hypothetical protein